MAAPSGLIVAWPSTAASIPAGWSRVAALNAVHPKASSAASGSTGGNLTHTHTAGSHQHTDTHSHSANNKSDTGDDGVSAGGSGTDIASMSHTHAMSRGATSFSVTADAGAASSSVSSVLSTYTVIWIQADGTTNIPSGAVMWWQTATAPTNWAYADGTATTPDLRNKYLLGAAVGVDGGTSVAASSHTHTYSHNHAATAHASHAVTVGAASGTSAHGAGVGAAATPSHNHTTGTLATASATPGSAYSTDATASDAQTPEPSYYKLLPIKKTASAADSATGLIGITTGSVPTGYVVCDGTNGTPNLNGNTYFIKGANTTGEIGNTGGAATHTHSISHGHTVPAHTHGSTGLSGTQTEAATNIDNASGASAWKLKGHKHTGGTTGAISGTTTVGTTALTLPANTSNDPPYSTVKYVMSTVTSASGTSTPVLPFPVMSASGGTTFRGTANLVTPFPIMSAAGKQTFRATANLTLPFPVMSAVGKTVFSGTSVLITPFPVMSSTGHAPLAGTSNLVLPFPVMSGSGGQSIHGTSVLILPFPVLVSTGDLVEPSGTPISLLIRLDDYTSMVSFPVYSLRIKLPKERQSVQMTKSTYILDASDPDNVRKL